MEMLADAGVPGVDHYLGTRQAIGENRGDQRVCVSGKSDSEIRLVRRQRHKLGGKRR